MAGHETTRLAANVVRPHRHVRDLALGHCASVEHEHADTASCCLAPRTRDRTGWAAVSCLWKDLHAVLTLGATSTLASGGTYRVSPRKNATITFSFTSTEVDWVTAIGPSDGMASVTIDGVSVGTVDLYAAKAHWQVLESYSGLASGPHTIVITVLGTKDAASKGANVVVDAFIVYS